MIRIGNLVINSRYIVSIVHNQDKDKASITVVTTSGNLDIPFDSYEDMIKEFLYICNYLEV